MLATTRNISAVAGYTRVWKLQGPRFQRNYIIARYQESDLHGTSFQSSPKINRTLITRAICIQWTFSTPDHCNFSPQGTPAIITALLCPKYDLTFRGVYFQKNWVGVCGTLPEILTLFQTKIWDFFHPISDLKPSWGSVLDPERVTTCYGMHTVVGVNIKREMVLSPNDEEVGNSSKKHTQFKTRVHKPYPISDQNG